MGRRAVVLVIALVLAGAAAFAIFQYLDNYRQELIAGQEQVPVFRAIQPILEGTLGDDVLLGGEGILYQSGFEQVEDLPLGAIRTTEDLRSILTGRVAVGPVAENGILIDNQWVAPSIELTPLKDSIAAGKQAITISPGDVQGINGFAQPGDKVNVIVTIDLPLNLTPGQDIPSFGLPATVGEEGSEDPGSVIIPFTRFVLQNLTVLAVGQEVVPPASDSQSVNVEGEIDSGEPAGEVQDAEAVDPVLTTVYTLEVDPNQAERLVYAIQEGIIYLTLVPDDNQEIATEGVVLDQLFGGNLLDDIFQN